MAIDTTIASPPGRGTPAQRLAALYQRIRRRTEELCAPLEVEDYVVQPAPDVTPPKWHLGHTTWFVEASVLSAELPRYTPYRSGYDVFFRSPLSGALSRPTVREVNAYRRFVDRAVLDLLARDDGASRPELGRRMTEVLHHEEQHQEQLLCDIKAILFSCPTPPQYRPPVTPPLPRVRSPLSFVDVAGGTVMLGAQAGRFAWDNERPRHPALLRGFRFAQRLVTNADYQTFMDDHGYEEPRWWLPDGWAIRRQRGWAAPLYWEKNGPSWTVFTLGGQRPLHPDEPVCHVSFFEADAYARWAKVRLPTETEWEHVATSVGNDAGSGNFLEDGKYHPAVWPTGKPVAQTAGDVWEWTQSAYTAYPGYRGGEAASLAESNDRIMNGRMVLRGGSCVCPRGLYRATYRHFLAPDQRRHFTGVRLAEDGREAAAS